MSPPGYPDIEKPHEALKKYFLVPCRKCIVLSICNKRCDLLDKFFKKRVIVFGFIILFIIVLFEIGLYYIIK